MNWSYQINLEEIFDATIKKRKRDEKTCRGDNILKNVNSTKPTKEIIWSFLFFFYPMLLS